MGLELWKTSYHGVYLKIDELIELKPQKPDARNKESRELNRTMQAIATAANIIGCHGMRYGEDFVFDCVEKEGFIRFDFCDSKTEKKAEHIFRKLSKKVLGVIVPYC